MSMPFIKASCTKRCQAITDVIEAIALEECAMSHILNAEGEILQQVVHFPDLCVDQISVANTSVADIIKHITCLEAELKATLNLFENCLCSCHCCDDRCNNDCDRC